MRRSTRTVTFGLGYPCCAGVLCAHGAPGARFDASLGQGGGQLVLRGGGSAERWERTAREARAAGFDEVVAATAGIDEVVPRGVDAIRAVLFSHVPAVHDRLTGRPDALVRALVALRAAAERVPLEVEAPLLSLRLSDPRALVDLVLRAIGAPRGMRFFVPQGAVPRGVAPPRFDAIGGPLQEAVERLAAAGTDVRFDPSQGIAPCAFDEAGMHARFSFRRGARRGCEGCAARDGCPGPTDGYRDAHEAGGLRPFARRPPALTGRPDDRRPRWSAREREAARHVRFVVLRPTVHCNQDCLFCSANESSNNVWSDPKAMMKAIVRVAQRGVRRVSFSGGEPTLSPHLPDFVRVAARCGVPEIEIVTNAVLLDREARVRRLTEAGLTHAFVSLHAHSEALSRAMTQKEGDHERTLTAIDHLLEAGVLVAVNHVVTARNQAYMSAFVDRIAERFGGRVLISFAFVTPQFRALEHPDLVPRLSDTMPHLRAAMRGALERGQPFVVGSRQGVPPCLLGPFAAWSDVFGLTSEAASEDTPQKVHGPACEGCRYRRICNGLWRPYVERHGADELVAVPGAPFSDDELTAIRRHHRRPPWGVPTSFDEAPPALRDLEAERAPPPPPVAPVVRLPVYATERTRPLRVLFVGSGRRARALAEAAPPELALAGVVSPHALDRPGWWGAVPAFADLAEALDATRPEALVVAAATDAHVELARAVGERWALLEKPVAPRSEDARALAGLPRLSCALQELFASGLSPVLDAEGDVLVTRRAPASGPDAPRAWGRAPLFEVLHHALTVPVVTRGGLREVRALRFEGDSAPTRLRAELALERGRASVDLDFSGASDALEVRVGDSCWRREGRAITVDGAPVEARGGELTRMLRAFREAVVAGAPPPVPIARGIAVLEATERLVEAFADAGAPLSRPTAPKHVASRRYRTGGSRR